MGFVSVYMTFKDAKEAERISEALVKERLIACANVFPEIRSCFRWKGALTNEKESAVIGKSTAKNAEKIVRRVKELHSYEIPCIVFWPIKAGNKDFFDWVGRETRNNVRKNNSV